MKTGKTTIKASTKNPTTNYAPDGHKAFCKRCLAQNGKCPKNGKQYADKSCTL